MDRGYAYDQLGDYEQAIADYDRAIELDPSSAKYDTLAMVYFKLEQYDQAMEHYDLALSLDDKNFYSHKGRGDVYLALDNQEAALADYEAYLSRAPAGPERDEVEAIVKFLQAP
ncbi:MAG TPA: tetratricopeptide repeat protein [Anaerolineae bacterium]|nr:tetratricopeptide repeat protein [Anaerolineae bacterium]